MCRQQNIPLEIEEEIVTLTNLILQPTYFTHLGRTYLQTESLAMGAHTLALYSEIYLQYLEECFSTVGPRPGTWRWHQLYWASRGKYFIVEIF
jgi:hypothetical protein